MDFKIHVTEEELEEFPEPSKEDLGITSASTSTTDSGTTLNNRIRKNHLHKYHTYHNILRKVTKLHNKKTVIRTRSRHNIHNKQEFRNTEDHQLSSRRRLGLRKTDVSEEHASSSRRSRPSSSNTVTEEHASSSRRTPYICTNNISEEHQLSSRRTLTRRAQNKHQFRKRIHNRTIYTISQQAYNYRQPHHSLKWTSTDNFNNTHQPRIGEIINQFCKAFGRQ